jgi:hypothetical protein
MEGDGDGEEEGEEEEEGEFPPQVEFVYAGLGDMLIEVETNVPLLDGVTDKLYSNEMWSHSFKTVMANNMDGLIENISPEKMLGISTAVLAGGVIWRNYKKMKLEEEEKKKGVTTSTMLFGTPTPPPPPAPTRPTLNKRDANPPPIDPIEAMLNSKGPVSRDPSFKF